MLGYSPPVMDPARSYAAQRSRFIASLDSIVAPGSIRALWTPSATEALAVPDGAVAGRIWTHATTPNGRLRPLGKGYSLTWNGASDAATAPDATDLSFGNSAVDVPFSMFALANVTDTGNIRAFFNKSGEYAFSFDGTDKLLTQLVDNSLAVVPSRGQDVATTRQATWALYSMTYSKATGGATAANDITLYENGAVVASTATNAGTYVAMEDLTNVPTLGALAGGTSGWMQGALALVLVVQSNALLAQHAQVVQVCRNYFGVPL